MLTCLMLNLITVLKLQFVKNEPLADGPWKIFYVRIKSFYQQPLKILYFRTLLSKDKSLKTSKMLIFLA